MCEHYFLTLIKLIMERNIFLINIKSNVKCQLSNDKIKINRMWPEITKIYIISNFLSSQWSDGAIEPYQSLHRTWTCKISLFWFYTVLSETFEFLLDTNVQKYENDTSLTLSFSVWQWQSNSNFSQKNPLFNMIGLKFSLKLKIIF